MSSRYLSTFQLAAIRVTAALLPGAILVGIIWGCGTKKPGMAQDGTGPFGVRSGPCSSEGETAACHQQIGAHDGFIDCFMGTQTCTNGLWGPCGAGGSGTLATVPNVSSSSKEGDLSLMSVTTGDASATSSSCTADPCNPYCMGFDTDAGTGDAGLQPEGGFASTSILGVVTTVQNFPGGATGPKANALPYPNCNPGDSWGYLQDGGGDGGGFRDCNYDFCCAADAGAWASDAGVGPSGATGNVCVPWVVVGGNDPVAAACPMPPAALPDFTLGIVCTTNGGTHAFVPICNRGNADATSGTLYVVGTPGNPNSVGTNAVCRQNNNTADGCLVDLSVRPIPAGKCISIDVYSSYNAAGTFVNGVKCNAATDFTGGNESAFVNPTNQTTLSHIGGTAYSRLPEADYCNDNSFVQTSSQGSTCSSYGSQPPPPAQYAFTYTATCPPGFVASWNLFTYSTSVPTQSDVLFTASTAQALSDGGPGTWSSPVTLADPGVNPSDPAVCQLSGSTWSDGGSAGACYKYLGPADGSPGLLGSNYTAPYLQIGITLTATSAIPTVNGWSVTYNCVPSE